MRIVVFGASGPTGKIVLQQGLSEGHELTAVVRNPASIEISHPNLKVVKGDVYEADSVAQAIANQDAVISTYGVHYSFKPITVYSVGMSHIIKGMQAQGVKRLVCVTSGWTRRGYDFNASLPFALIIKGWVGRTLYDDMRRMEQLVMRTDLDWTIVRPSRLIDDPNLGDYRVSIGYSLPKGYTTKRVELANYLVKEVADKQYLQKAVAVATNL